MWACLSHTKGKFQDSNPDFRFDLPILAQGLPALFLEGLPAVLFIRRSSGGLADLFASDGLF